MARGLRSAACSVEASLATGTWAVHGLTAVVGNTAAPASAGIRRWCATSAAGTHLAAGAAGSVAALRRAGRPWLPVSLIGVSASVVYLTRASFACLWRAIAAVDRAAAARWHGAACACRAGHDWLAAAASNADLAACAAGSAVAAALSRSIAVRPWLAVGHRRVTAGLRCAAA